VSTDSPDNTLDSVIREWDSRLVAYIRQRVPTAAIAAVGTHLGRAYRELGLPSRTQLAVRMSAR